MKSPSLSFQKLGTACVVPEETDHEHSRVQDVNEQLRVFTREPHDTAVPFRSVRGLHGESESRFCMGY